MPTAQTPSQTKAAIRRASRSGRESVTRLLGNALKEFGQTYEQASDEIKAEITAYADGGGTLTLSVLQSVLEQINGRLHRLSVDRNRILEDSLLDAADIGVSPFQANQKISISLPGKALYAAQFTANFIDANGLNLADKLWRVDNHARESVGQAVQQAVVKGWSASKAAQDFLSRGVAIPKEVAAQMQAANATAVGRSVIDSLMTGVGNPYANARRVFRTEINRAHGEAFRGAAFADPDVIGTRFLLSPNHPRVDICDMHASVNRYGLGKGIYPKGKSPWPAHPNTLSFETVVFYDDVTDEDKAGKEDRIAWLNKQPDYVRFGVLGSQKKVAALDRGLLPENAIATPWKVLKKRLKRKGINTDSWAGGSSPPLPEAPEFEPIAPRAGFVPAKTPQAAARWAMENDLADYADYSGAKPEVANAWNKSVFEHVNEFPELRKNIQFVGTTQARNRRWRELVIEDYIQRLKVQNPGYGVEHLREFAERRVKRPRISGNVWAVSTSDKWTSGVSVNGRWAKDVDGFKDSLRLNVENKFHPIGADSIKSVIDHELGHQLDGLLDLARDESLQSLHQAWLKGRNPMDDLSGYALKNVAEFIAEAWAEYRNAGQPRQLAAQVGQLIQKRYREKFSG